MRRRAALVAAAAAVVAVAIGAVVPTGDDDAARPRRSEAEATYLEEVRAERAPASLRARTDADLLARGRRFCDDLRETGSSLRAVFRRQVAGQTYEGQGNVATAARRRLCPHLPDTDADR